MKPSDKIGFMCLLDRIESSLICKISENVENSERLIPVKSTIFLMMQDASSLIRQSDKFSEYGEILAHLFRSLQSYRVGNLVEAYLAFEKFAK